MDPSPRPSLESPRHQNSQLPLVSSGNGILVQTRIRCQCGSELDEGEMIECEQCMESQHAICMGILDPADSTNYKCEICKPRLLMISKPEAMQYQNDDPAEINLTDVTNTAKPNSKKKTGKPFDFDNYIKYLAEEAEYAIAPFVLTKFFTKYKNVCGFEGSAQTLQQKCRAKLSSEIHLLSQFDLNTRAKMIFVMSLRVGCGFLKTLKSFAKVRVDKFRRIISYQSKTLKFKGKPARSGPKNLGEAKKSVGNVIATSRYQPSVEPPLNDDDENDLKVVYEGKGEYGPGPHLVKKEQEYEYPLSYKDSGEITMSHHNVTPNYNNKFIPTLQHTENYGGNGLETFFSSMTNFMEAQAILINESSRSGTQEHDSHSRPFGLTNETTSVKDFLKFIQVYILNLHSLRLSEVNHQIQVHLHRLGIEDKKIPMSKLRLALESIFALSVTSATSEPCSAGSPGAKRFLNFIRVYVANLKSQNLSAFHEQLKKKIDALEESQKIPLEKLNQGFEASIAIILQ